jgi:hypothetical protein
MLSSGTKYYHEEANAVIWSILHAVKKIIINVNMRYYHVMLSCGMIT